MQQPPPWLTSAVAAFGVACRDRLAGPGDREAAIRSPLEALLGAAGAQIGVPAAFHDEVRDPERQVRPDYGVSVGGAITGYVEVEAPGRPVDPATFHGHDLRQWQRQRDLPNLIHTNGTEWRLHHDGEPVTLTGGSLDVAGPPRRSSASSLRSRRTSSTSTTSSPAWAMRPPLPRVPLRRSSSSLQFRSVAGAMSNSPPTCWRAPNFDPG